MWHFPVMVLEIKSEEPVWSMWAPKWIRPIICTSPSEPKDLTQHRNHMTKGQPGVHGCHHSNPPLGWTSDGCDLLGGHLRPYFTSAERRTSSSDDPSGAGLYPGLPLQPDTAAARDEDTGVVQGWTCFHLCYTWCNKWDTGVSVGAWFLNLIGTPHQPLGQHR